MRNTKEGASPSLFSLAFKLTSLAVLCGLLLVIVIMGYSASAAKNKQVTVTANGQLRDEAESLRLKNDSPDVLMKHLQRERDPGKKTVYLTFDDGPSPYTEQLLNVLKANGAKATFLCLNRG